MDRGTEGSPELCGVRRALRRDVDQGETIMTSEEWGKHVAVEKKARAEAVALLCQALQKAGVPLLSLKIIEDGSDCTVEAMFKYGARHWEFAMRTSAWTPRRPRSGIFCGRSPSSGNH